MVAVTHLAIGISRASLRMIQPVLIAGSVAGTALILWDLQRRTTLIWPSPPPNAPR